MVGLFINLLNHKNRIIKMIIFMFLIFYQPGDSLSEVTAKVVSNSKCNNITTICADVLSNADACQVRHY